MRTDIMLLWLIIYCWTDLRLVLISEMLFYWL